MARYFVEQKGAKGDILTNLSMESVFAGCPRTHLDALPLRSVQRRDNRQPCFFAEEDCHAGLHWLSEALNNRAAH